MLTQICEKVDTNPSDLVLEAYGIKQETDINAGLFVDEFDRAKFSPREIQTIFLGANRLHRNDLGERFVDFNRLNVELPTKMVTTLNLMITLSSDSTVLFQTYSKIN